MKIDKALNLVLTVDRDGFTIHVHSSPISEEVFENYYLPISKTFAGIYDEGVALAAPRIAGMMLKDVSKRLGLWEGEEGVQAGLMKEIERLTNVLVPGDNGGFVSMPLESALARDKISTEEYREIFGQIIFFIVISAMHKKKLIPQFLAAMTNMWGGVTTSSNSTEYADYLTTSTAAANTGEKVAVQSSIPS